MKASNRYCSLFYFIAFHSGKRRNKISTCNEDRKSSGIKVTDTPKIPVG